MSQTVLGRLTEEEAFELNEWRKMSPENEAFYQDAVSRASVRKGLRALDNLNSDSVKAELDRRIGFEEREVRRVNRFRWVWIPAACVMLVAGVRLWRWKTQDVNKPEVHELTAKTEQTFPVGNKATLVLADGRKIDLGVAANGQLATEAGLDVKKVDSNLVTYGKGAGDMGTNRIETPRAGQFRVVLSDGTKVWLNNASSLSYPVKFNGTKRSVALTGQAYFEIAEDKARPFYVETSQGKTVEVLGTSFDVSAYPDEVSEKTTLVEGKVMVRSVGKPVVLSPGEQAVVERSDGKISVKTVDANTITSWRNGFFAYENADLKAVFKEIGRWYDVDIRFEGPVPASRLSGGISRDNSLKDVIELMEERHIHCRLEEKTLVISQ